MPPEVQPVKLAFADKYDRTHAEQYQAKHRAGIARRLSHWRDVQLASRALKEAGDPLSVLDLPCGAGRFWPMLMENPARRLIAADNSSDMLDVAALANPGLVDHGVQLLKTSAFAIDLPDRSADCIFCMRLLHHIGESADRLALLKEFNRVSRDTVILSLWVDGNFKAWRRRRLDERRRQYGRSGFQNRFVIPAQQAENEFIASGFRVVGFHDFLPGYAMWRVYVLKKT